MASEIIPGLEGRHEFTVETGHLASEVGSGLVSVFSTAMMIAGMETAAVGCVQGLLGPGWTTVGVHVDVSHRSATPAGMKVSFLAVLEEISANGKGLVFHVEARDEAGIIGEGSHRRVVVEKEPFEARTRRKLADGPD